MRSVVPPLGLATPFLYQKPVRLPGRPVTVACLPRGPQLDWIHEMFGGLVPLISVGDGAEQYSHGKADRCSGGWLGSTELLLAGRSWIRWSPGVGCTSRLGAAELKKLPEVLEKVEEGQGCW